MYTIVADAEGLKAALSHLDREVQVEPLVALDTETYSTGVTTIYGFSDPHTNAIRLIQMKTRNGNTYVFDLKRLRRPQALFDFLNRDDITWVAHNAKFEYKMLLVNCKVELKKIYCTYIAGCLIGYATGMSIRASCGLGLKDLLRDFMSVEMDKTEQTSYWGGSLTTEQYDYAASDVLHLIELHDILRSAIDDEYESAEAMQLEMDVLPVVCEMEVRGIGFDLVMYRRVQQCAKLALPAITRQLCEAFGTTMQRVYVLEEKRFSLVPAGINLNSRDDMLASFLKVGIELPDLQAETLKNLAETYSIIQIYLDYKLLSKQLSTDYEKYIHPVTGRIHPTFNQVGTATARFSSTHPNQQQVPKLDIRIPDQLVIESDKKYFDKKRNGYYLNYRYCFSASDGGYIASSDFSGQETSIMAVLSMDKTMIDILNRPQLALIDGKWVENPDADLHAQTAALAFGIDPKDARTKHPKWNGKTYRDGTKAVTFGTCYGQSEHALGPQLGISVDEAKQIINRFFKPLPGLKRWLDDAARAANLTRLSVFALGRTRFLNDSRHADKGAVGRAGMNVPIQGTGALMMKKALVFLETRLKSLRKLGISAYIVGTVHDEVLVEFLTPPEQYWDHTDYPGDHRLASYIPEQRYIVNAILECMDLGSNFFLKDIVPDRASCGVGRTWTK